jgi:tetratricopeptide (TPR) repeat protein
VLVSVAVAATPPQADLPPQADQIVTIPGSRLTADELARRDALARYSQGVIANRHELPVRAIRHFQQAAATDPKSSASPRELAKIYAELGREPAAIRAACAVLKIDPDDHEIARLLGRIYTDAKRHPDAVSAFRLACNSPKLTDPLIRFAILKDLSRVADAANLHQDSETARREAIKLITTSRTNLLQPGLFNAKELDFELAKSYEGLGSVLVKRKEYAAASAAFQTAREHYADPKGANDLAGVARLHWNLSGSLLAQGNATEARNELERYLKSRPAGFEPYERLLEVYRQLNIANELPVILAGYAEENRNNTAPQLLAATLMFSRDPGSADAVFRKLWINLKSTDEARVMVAAYCEVGRSKQLLDLLDKTFQAARPEGYDDTDRPQAERTLVPPPLAAVQRARLISAAMKQQSTQNGCTKLLLKKLVEERGQTERHTDTLELISSLAFRDGQNAIMSDILQESAKRRKNNLRLKFLTIQSLEHQRNWSVITQIARELSNTEKGGWYPSIAASEAVAYAELGMKEAALKRLKEIGDSSDIQMKRVRILNILGEHSESLRICEEELKGDKLSLAELRQIRLMQADTLILLNKNQEAEAIQRRLLDEDPDDLLILNNLGYQLADQGRKLEEAELFIRRAIELDRYERTKQGDPEAGSGGYADSLGWALFRRGKLVEARTLLEQAVVSPESAPDAIVWDHLGDVAFRQGDQKRAATAWKKASQLYASTHLGKQFGRAAEVERKLKLTQ